MLCSLCLRQSITQTAAFDLSDIFGATNSLDVYTVLHGYLFLFLRCQEVNSPRLILPVTHSCMNIYTLGSRVGERNAINWQSSSTIPSLRLPAAIAAV